MSQDCENLPLAFDSAGITQTVKYQRALFQRFAKNHCLHPNPGRASD